MNRVLRFAIAGGICCFLANAVSSNREYSFTTVTLHAEPDPCLGTGEAYADLAGNTTNLDNYAETFAVDSPCWSHTASWIDGDPGGAETDDGSGGSSCTAHWQGSFHGYYDGYSNHWVFIEDGPWAEVAEHYHTQTFVN